jgi:hypothetical protein
MTSQIDSTTIDALYPVAGKDNDSQGFRDNFAAIKTGLATAGSEITDLQTSTLKTGVVNDLTQGSIVNGHYNNFYGSSYINSVSGSTDISITAGEIQVFTMATSISFTLLNWPADTYYGKVRIHLLSDSSEIAVTAGSFIAGKKYTIISTGSTDWNVAAGTTGVVYVNGSTFVAAVTGSGDGTAKQWREAVFLPSNKIVFESNIDTPIKVNPDGTQTVLEAWSFSNGDKIFIRQIGTF